MSSDVPAQDLLERYITTNGLRYSDIADRLAPPVHKTLVGRWIKGECRPSSAHREQLEKITSEFVPASMWITEDERNRAAWLKTQEEQKRA